MPIQTLLAQFESPIITIQPLQEPLLGIVTAAHEIFLYNTQTQETEKILRLNLHADTKLIYAFNPRHMRLIFGEATGTNLHMVDLKQKKIVNKFELNQQSPDVIIFSPDGSHFICGTNQGRVFLWRVEANTLIARLHSYPEYTSLYTKPKNNGVYALAFQGEWLATSGYGGSVVITNYQSQTKTKRFHPGHLQNSALLFYQNSLIIGNQGGTILKIDRDGKYTNYRLSTSLGMISTLLRIGPEPYFLAAGEKPFISLINGDTMRVIIERYIEFKHPITSLCKDNNEKLYVTTSSGELFGFDLRPLNQLESLIAVGSYAEAYRYCEEEPLVKESSPYLLLESLFQQEMKKARKALEAGEVAQAKTLLKPFASVKSKEITSLLTSFAQYEKFKYLFDHLKFAPFYGIAEQYPMLTETALYRHVEKLWSEKFIKAQKLMFLNKGKEALSELQLFANVNSKRPLIQLLLHHVDIFKLYSKALQESNYTQLDELTLRYPILRKLPSYIQTIKEAGDLIGAITEALQLKEFDHASLLLHELSSIIQYQDECHRLTQFYTVATNLNHALMNHHWRTAYHLLDSNPELLILSWAQEVETRWYQLITRCEQYAVRGDIASIKKEFGNLINLPYRHERVGDIFRTAYQIELKRIMKTDPKAFGEGINNYCEIFGMDTELGYLLNSAQRNEIDLTLDSLQLHPKKRDHWLMYAKTLPEHITDPF